MDNLIEYKMDLIAEALGAYRIEEVASVVRRHYTRSDGEEAELIDFYPPWSPSGSFGVYKVASEYMDDAWQRERFEKYAGVKIADLPAFEGQQAMQRRFGRPHRCEVEVQPFRLMVQPQRNDEGKDGKTLILRYLTSQRARPPKAQAQAIGQAQPGAQSQPTAAKTNGNGNGSHSQAPTPPPATSGQQPATNPQRPATKTATAVSPAQWLERARAAEDPLDFDLCVSRGLVMGNGAYFETVDHAEKARTGLFGDWKPGVAAAYLAGIEKYVTVRSDLLAAGEPGTAVFRAAKGAALVAYRQVLDAAVPA